MRVVMFYHSLCSDWNHGNAHFLRGVASELLARGHDVTVWEPRDAWSARELVRWNGRRALGRFARRFPALAAVGSRYALGTLDLDAALDGADLVLVHEWNPPALIARIGRHRARGGAYRLLFHDTHHRAVSERPEMAALALDAYDGVLAFGAVLRDLYVARGWARRAYTWHEAADVRVFRPRPTAEPAGDLVWIGNWGDGERSRELATFLVETVRALGLDAQVYGVRYPKTAQRMLARAGIAYGGWIANFDVPDAFARHRVTIHVPRRPYTRALPGIPTIRPFEALACGVPLVSAWWDDVEELFTAGADYLVARTGAEMRRHLRTVLRDRDVARALAAHGLATIRARHTCAHRVDELLRIAAELGATPAEAEVA